MFIVLHEMFFGEFDEPTLPLGEYILFLLGDLDRGDSILFIESLRDYFLYFFLTIFLVVCVEVPYDY